MTFTKKKKEIHQYSKRDNRNGFLFVLPWIIGFLAFTLYPILSSLYYSLCEYTVVNDPVFVGFANYKTLFTEDPLFYKSMGNTLYMVFIGMALCTLVGLCSSVLLNNKRIKGLSVFRVVFFIPKLVPVVVTCVLWMWILQPQSGLLNTLLGYVGIKGPGWIASPTWAKPGLILMMIWAQGSAIILYLAALQDIPEALYESADIDGASFLRKTVSITLPMLAPVILYNVTTGIISVFQWFAEPLIMTNTTPGAPDNSLLFYALHLYINAFTYFKMGYASAMAWVLLLIALALILCLFKLTSRFSDTD